MLSKNTCSPEKIAMIDVQDKMKIILLFILIHSLGTFANDIIVHLANGAVQGDKMTGERGNVFYSFRGIPYAEPPVGNLRFKPPVPKRPWGDVIDATKEGPICPQVDFFMKQLQGTEDCLYLNVFTPKLPQDNDQKKLDVLFNIHGGGFKLGAGGTSFFGPARMPLEDMIMVSPNYRIGPLGFLSTNDSSSPGNYGLLDQTEALRWVRNNIHHFGGDPNRVTILGASAGGASVVYQMLTPFSEGLFQRAVSLSGSALNPWALQKDPVFWAKKLAKTINCPVETSEEMVACLRGKSANELIENSEINIRSTMLFTFSPTVDGTFIETDPLDILKEGKLHKNVPIIIGATKNEGNCWYLGREDSPDDFTEEEILEALQHSVDVRPNIDEVIKRVRDRYLSTLTSYKEDDVQKLLGKALTDGMFLTGIYESAKLMAEHGRETYLYRYDFKTENDWMLTIYNKSGDYGICHGAGIEMLFKGTLFPQKLSASSENLMKSYHKLLLNFIRFGNPTEIKDDDIKCEWPAAKANNLHQYHFNTQCSVDVYDETKDENYNFWTKEIRELYSKNKLSKREEL